MLLVSAAIVVMVLSSLPQLSTEAAAEDRQSPEIAIQPWIEHQTMSSWEATAWAGQDSSPNFANYSADVLDMIVDEVGINRLRLEVRACVENPEDYWTQWQTGAVDYAFWRSHRYSTINDDGDTDTINWSGFHFSELDYMVEELVLPFIQRVKANGERPYINLNYVAFTSQNGAGLQYIHDDPNEYAEFMLATFLHLEGNYSLVPDLIEILLEPDNVAQWNGGTIGRAIVATRAKLAAQGFHPGFIAPSNTNMGGAITYFDQMAAVPGAVENLTEYSYHRYGSVSDANLMAIDDRRVQHGLRTSMLEHIGSGYADLHKDLTLANCSSWQQFAMAGFGPDDGGGVYLLIDETDPTDPVVTLGRRTKFLTQYFRYVREGATRIGATTTDGAIEPTAFINTNGSYAVVAKAASGSDLTILGLPIGTYGVRYTTSDQYGVESLPVSVDLSGRLSAFIPSAGVITAYSIDLAPTLEIVPDPADTTILEGESINFTVIPHDEDVENLTIEWSVDGVTIGGWDELYYNYTADHASAGVHMLSVKATDKGGWSTANSLPFNVIDVNRPPVIDDYYPTPLWILNETEDGFVLFSILAHDPDSDPLTHTWYVDSVEVVPGTGFEYRFEYDYFSAGEYDIDVVVSDGKEEVNRTWHVIIYNVNRPPVLTNATPESPLYIYEEDGTFVNFTIDAMDPDHDPMTFHWSINEENQTRVTGLTYVFPTDHESSGYYVVIIRVNDTMSDTFISWRMMVEDINRPPVIKFVTSPAEVWVNETEGGSTSFGVDARDPDDDSLFFEWYIDGTRIKGEESDSYAFTYGFESAGDYQVMVVVDDSMASDSHTWSLHINNTNRAPYILSVLPKRNPTLNVTEATSFEIGAVDPDVGEALSYQWYLEGIPIEGVTGPVHTLVPAKAGTYTLAVNVSDPWGSYVIKRWQVTVMEPAVGGPGNGNGGNLLWVAIPFIVLIAVGAMVLRMRTRA
jgi:hypothetical protein